MSAPDKDIWFRNLSVLFNQNYHIFFPSQSMTEIEKHNSVIRFVLYLCILVFILTNGKNTNVFSILFITCIGSIIIFKHSHNINYKKLYLNKEDFNSNQYCQEPTKHNPFMNVLVSDYVNNPEKLPSCNVEDETTKQNIEKQFFEDVFMDVNDIYDKNSSYRQFYTMPNTIIPNDQTKFAKELYHIKGKTCKEGNGLKCKYFVDSI